ncbi:alpha-ketoacid dehydrogenase subunit beta [Pseudokordiimonas caeni]|uniref:alpha-ketoacid dehydrogenase subunit beta n=1 Tax=Pseudokordiimonas caeni TaxID=2997908 RepID=UPI002810DD44|nr:transketolase C-terminal domain-containing protein [Pseudokordiimonas caeni]
MSDGRMLSYGAALLEAIEQEMERDQSVFVMGQGVDDQKGQYGSTLGLHKKFGAARNFDTPIAEDAMTGIAVGAALAGMRPVHVHQRMDFLMLCMNQLVNMAAKYSYMSAGQVSVPMVVRASIGRSWGQGPQHSQAPYPFFMHVPGLKVLAPTTPHDAKGSLIAAIRDDTPVLIVEHRLLYGNQGIVPATEFEIEFGKARILRKGSHVTLVGVSYTVVDCLRAASMLASCGIDAEVIDLLSLAPLDSAAVLESAARTGRLVVVDNSWVTCGAGAELLARLQESPLGEHVRAKRLGYAPVTCPTTRPLEDIFYPSPRSVAVEAMKLCGRDPADLGELAVAREIEEFKGPF